jgi:tryptophanyl-tRNA synthetase
MIVGAFNILAGIITTIQQFLKITQLNEAHRVSSISWDKFYRNIKIELAKHPHERIPVIQMLKMSKEEFDRLMETSPTIPDKIIESFKTSFKQNEEFEKISKPEICDVMISTESFLNPWNNDDNKIKRITDMKYSLSLREINKKHHDEIYVLSVNNFIKSFIQINNRKPTDNEIIDNLQDEIPIDILRSIIDDQKFDNVV